MHRPPTHPVLVYDGDCGFCTRSAAWLTAKGEAQARAAFSLDLSPDDAARTSRAAGWLVDGEFRVWGAAAIAATLRQRSRWSWPLGWALTLPVIRTAAELVYGWVATHRHKMPGGTQACSVGPAAPPTPWPRRLVVAVLFLQVAVPLIALNDPPTRFGFQMYSGIASTGIEVRDRAGRVVELDEDLLPGTLRGDLPWWRDLPEFICVHQESAHVVAVATAEGQEWLVTC